MVNFKDEVEQHILAVQNTIKTEQVKINTVIEIIYNALQDGNKLLFFGNGGSAADSQHIVAEFVNRFETERAPLAAIALTTDVSVLTSISNDYSFGHIFSKQIKAIGKKGDVAIGLSTSGNSPNVIKAFKVAKQKQLTTIMFTGNNELYATSNIDIIIHVQSIRTATIQEVHTFIWHAICKAIDCNYCKN